MDNKVRATLNEFENYEYYRKKSTELVEKIRLCEWDLYFNIGSSLKYEDYFEWENGRYVKKTKLKDPIHNPFSGRARHEQLEKERDDLIKRKTLVDAQISVIEYNLGLLSPDTRQIVNVCYLGGNSLEKGAEILSESGLNYSPQALYNKVIREMTKKKDLFI